MILTELPDFNALQISHAFAVKGATPAGVAGTFINGGALVALRGDLFFSSGISGLRGPRGTTITDADEQGKQFYSELRARLDAAGAGYDDLLKVNIWINSKPAKNLALIGWKEIFGTIDEGAREKTPGRTFLIHAQPAMDDDVLLEAEIVGVLPARDTR